MGELTGRKVAAITVSAFAVIIGVNLVMAWQAIATFPGLEVANSYVASQTFDADRKAQQALGWTVAADYTPGALVLRMTDAAGSPVTVGTLDVLVGRATAAQDDSRPVFVAKAAGYVAPLDLARGKWLLHVKATATDGTPFQQRLELFVKG